jgi:TonB family protein
VEVSAVPAPGRTGGRLRPPRKVRNVPPFYPPELVEKGAAGVVVVEALIATTGCVAEAEVVRSVERTLDASAVAAVSAWRYQPAILDGTVVPVLMTISVNFAIER